MGGWDNSTGRVGQQHYGRKATAHCWVEVGVEGGTTALGEWDISTIEERQQHNYTSTERQQNKSIGNWLQHKEGGITATSTVEHNIVRR